MNDERTHALYRFYDTDGNLLYVGITLNPAHRWKQHAHDKPWWHQIATISVQTYPNREAVLEAERAAIIAERPRHNIVHNRGTATDPRPVPQLDRMAPFQPGDWVALGLRDGRCPVGEIAALDDTWVSIRLKSFWDGHITHHATAVRWDDIARVELAYPEDSTPHSDGIRVMDDEHLGEFQTAWERTHLGDDKDPVEKTRATVRQENHQHREAHR